MRHSSYFLENDVLMKVWRDKGFSNFVKSEVSQIAAPKPISCQLLRIAHEK